MNLDHLYSHLLVRIESRSLENGSKKEVASLGNVGIEAVPLVLASMGRQFQGFGLMMEVMWWFAIVCKF